MLRTTCLVVCAFCAGAGGTAWWTTWSVRAHETAAAAAVMPSIEELHFKAGARSLPDQTVKEPF